MTAKGMKLRSLLTVVSVARLRVHAFDLPKSPCGLKSAYLRVRMGSRRKKSGAPSVSHVSAQPCPSDFPGENETGSRDSPIKCVDVAICGGGPAGLLSAIMMAERFPLRKTFVFDRLQRPPSPDDSAVWDDVAKFYLIGIGGRGQNALKRFGVWDEVVKRGVPILGRKGASPLSPSSTPSSFFLSLNLLTFVRRLATEVKGRSGENLYEARQACDDNRPSSRQAGRDSCRLH